MPKTIIVDASCNILYASFYLKGIRDNPNYKVKFKSRPFRGLDHENQYLALIIKDVAEQKIIVDFGNFDKIYKKAFDWSDVYGKVNVNEEDLIKDQIVSIGPLTAINIFGPFSTFWYALTNFVKSVDRIPNIKSFLGLYRAQLKRPRLNQYHQETSKPNYIFFASSLWKKEKEANDTRANFIKACKALKQIDFEGGFAPRTKDDIPGYEKLTMTERLKRDVFLDKIKKSSIAFNTPSVGGCNGWRLAEYLGMGKAIISTPLVRVMPGDFTDEQHYLITDGSIHDLEHKILQLTKDENLRGLLERNAKDYFEQVLSPEAVMKKLITHKSGNV